ncbi:MAG: DNA-deoxyinosine glycosylase [Flavobacteriaceae bacterium]|jgi:hypoxanthine-DNA glycosylase|nr:DNA-deoxyinosine glycosylase [Flavobacteriaceae bacterium]
MEDRINSFPPFIDKDSKILILGTVPGVKSLEMQQYYAHPQNHFWKIMFHLLAEPMTSDYEEKVAMLQRNGIAIWDTIESCVRKGSKDTDIKNEEANDIAELLKEFPNIKAVFCNGQKAFKNLSKQLKNKEVGINFYGLPSTSPLHTVGFEKKLPEWEQILHYL